MKVSSAENYHSLFSTDREMKVPSVENLWLTNTEMKVPCDENLFSTDTEMKVPCDENLFSTDTEMKVPSVQTVLHRHSHESRQRAGGRVGRLQTHQRL